MAILLRAAIKALFYNHRMSVARLGGEGYDEATNMHGKFNGLKVLIMKKKKKKCIPCSLFSTSTSIGTFRFKKKSHPNCLTL